MLIVGAGDIGRRVIAQTRRHDQVFAATSTPSKRSGLRRCGAIPILADLDRPGTLKRLPHDWDALIHAAPPQSYLTRDIRTRNLLRATRPGNTSARVVVYLSTSGVYGDCRGARITEAHAVNPRNARAKRRTHAERALIRAARRGAFRLAILRVPGIYAADRLPLARLKAGTPALLSAEDVYTNHIHAADLASLTRAALQRMRRRVRPRVRIYHASDDSVLKMGDYFDLVADAFGLARPPRLPRAQVAATVSPMLLSFMSESRLLDNTRMKRELGVTLQFPTAADGVRAAARLTLSQA